MSKLSDKHWLKDAACKELGIKDFFSFLPDEINKAKAICATCPVQKPCMLEYFEASFIAAGTTRFERLNMIWQRITDPYEETNFDY